MCDTLHHINTISLNDLFNVEPFDRDALQSIYLLTG